MPQGPVLQCCFTCMRHPAMESLGSVMLAPHQLSLSKGMSLPCPTLGSLCPCCPGPGSIAVPPVQQRPFQAGSLLGSLVCDVPPCVES